MEESLRKHIQLVYDNPENKKHLDELNDVLSDQTVLGDKETGTKLHSLLNYLNLNNYYESFDKIFYKSVNYLSNAGLQDKSIDLYHIYQSNININNDISEGNISHKIAYSTASMGFQYLLQGNIETCKKYFNKIITDYPDSTVYNWARYIITDLNSQEPYVEVRRKSFWEQRRLLSLPITNGVLYTVASLCVTLAEIYRKSGLTVNQEAVLMAAISTRPINTKDYFKNDENYHTRILKLLKTTIAPQISEALLISYLKDPKRHRSNRLERTILHSITEYYYKKKHYAKAKSFLDQHCSLVPESSISRSAVIKSEMGRYYLEANEPEIAAKNLKHAASFYKNHNDDFDYNREYYWLAKSYLLKGDYKLARKTIDRSIKEEIYCNQYVNLAQSYLLKAKIIINQKHKNSVKESVKNFCYAENLYNFFHLEFDAIKNEFFNEINDDSYKLVYNGIKSPKLLPKIDLSIYREVLKKKIRSTIDGKEMVLIDEGSFYFGPGTINKPQIKALFKFNEKENNVSGKHAKLIYIYPYYIDKQPVSNKEYLTFCKETHHDQPIHWKNGMYPRGAGNLPVVNISLEDARDYANWAGKALPNEVEWEKACRGSNGSTYPWGENWNHDFVLDSIIKEESGDEEKGQLPARKKSFKIPKHPNTDFDEEYFQGLLERSISLTLEEKQRVIDAIPRLNIGQINELIKIFEEEKEKFSELEKEHKNDVQTLKINRELEILFNKRSEQSKLKAIFNKELNQQNPYGLENMVGVINQWIEVTGKDESKPSAKIKGGSFASYDQENDCKAFNSRNVDPKKAAFDRGFRCVKLLF